MRNKLQHAASATIVIVVVLELTVIIGTWIGSAMFSITNVRSLLSAEGVRWYVGAYSDVLATPYLIWILLAGLTYGIVSNSKVVDALQAQLRRERMEFIDRLSLHAAQILFAFILMLIMYLVCAPHAVLLSATGRIYGSSFSSGIMPLLTMLLTIPSLTYALGSSKFKSITDIFNAMVHGVTKTVPLIILYIFVMHLIMTVQYIY